MWSLANAKAKQVNLAQGLVCRGNGSWQMWLQGNKNFSQILNYSNS